LRTSGKARPSTRCRTRLCGKTFRKYRSQRQTVARETPKNRLSCSTQYPADCCCRRVATMSTIVPQYHRRPKNRQEGGSTRRRQPSRPQHRLYRVRTAPRGRSSSEAAKPRREPHPPRAIVTGIPPLRAGEPRPEPKCQVGCDSFIHTLHGISSPEVRACHQVTSQAALKAWQANSRRFGGIHQPPIEEQDVGADEMVGCLVASRGIQRFPCGTVPHGIMRGWHPTTSHDIDKNG
jgi:hypothetical protein